jgi:hypothetical protein
VCQTPTRGVAGPRFPTGGHKGHTAVLRDRPHTRGWFVDDSTSEHHQSQPHGR